MPQTVPEGESIRYLAEEKASDPKVVGLIANMYPHRSLEELGECVSGRESVETEVEARRLKELLDAFLWAQDEERRNLFLLRYWYFESIDGICRRTGYSRSKIKSMLFHTRKKLRAYLEKEGVAL